jgi:hypothetical protein
MAMLSAYLRLRWLTPAARRFLVAGDILLCLYFNTVAVCFRLYFNFKLAVLRCDLLPMVSVLPTTCTACLAYSSRSAFVRLHEQ